MQISTIVLCFHLFKDNSNIYFRTHSRLRMSSHFGHRRLQK